MKDCGRKKSSDETQNWELLNLQAQLRREIALAEEKGIPPQPAKRKLAMVNKEISKVKAGEKRGGLFDTQLEPF